MGENMTELLGELADVLQLKDKINSIDKDNIETFFTLKRNVLKKIGMRAAKIEDGERLSKAIEHLYKKTTFTDLGKLRDRVNELYGGVRCRANDQKITNELRLIYELSKKIDSWMTDDEKRHRELHRTLKFLAHNAEQWSPRFGESIFETTDACYDARRAMDTARFDCGCFGDALNEANCSDKLVALVGTLEGDKRDTGLTGMFNELKDHLVSIYVLLKNYGQDSRIDREKQEMCEVLGRVRKTWSSVVAQLPVEMPKDVKWSKYSSSFTRNINAMCDLMTSKHGCIIR